MRSGRGSTIHPPTWIEDGEMTDRYNALTVILEKDIRSDDAESLIAAIRHES